MTQIGQGKQTKITNTETQSQASHNSHLDGLQSEVDALSESAVTRFTDQKFASLNIDEEESASIADRILKAKQAAAVAAQSDSEQRKQENSRTQNLETNKKQP